MTRWPHSYERDTTPRLTAAVRCVPEGAAFPYCGQSQYITIVGFAGVGRP
jgi:hypothetical protein